ncbi:hypothetical protein HaLaN_11078 [Haematococcus lacustris]|uniref:Uncharacterized protein n=1 Tax=Haematococcus lacustris TaxID=44745 RepID=A0A699Z6K3_HAELA|nr:hypothetical protein HaLaN_11078 [Haematococcus lacustris]
MSPTADGTPQLPPPQTVWHTKHGIMATWHHGQGWGQVTPSRSHRGQSSASGPAPPPFHWHTHLVQKALHLLELLSHYIPGGQGDGHLPLMLSFHRYDFVVAAVFGDGSWERVLQPLKAKDDNDQPCLVDASCFKVNGREMGTLAVQARGRWLPGMESRMPWKLAD